MNAKVIFTTTGRWIAAQRMDGPFFKHSIERWTIVGMLLGMLFFPKGLKGQAPYLGGAGDGYHMSETSFRVDWDPEKIDTVSVFPNPVLQGEAVTILVQALRNKLTILLHDQHGHLVWKNMQWDVVGIATATMPTTGLPAGVYLLEVIGDGRAVKRKIVVQQE